MGWRQTTDLASGRGACAALSRRDLLRRGAAGAAGLAAAGWLPGLTRRAVAAEAGQTRRPNVVFILSDDQNADTIGCFGGQVWTPNLDRLAAEGVRFERAYTVHSVCTPSRYTCLTGQFASRCGSPGFLGMCPPGTPSNVGFNVQVLPGTATVARVLHDAGYATGFVGKWHTGGPKLLPYAEDADLGDPKVAEILAEDQRRICEYIRQCGFDYAASVYRGNLKDHKLKALDVHNMEWVTKGALDFIEQNRERPFFLHVCPTLQHSPAPNRSLSGDPRVTPAGLLPEPPAGQAPRASIAGRLQAHGVDAAMGHATWLDDAVGAILEKLAALGLLDNTVVLFFSDNGTLGGKGTCYEGGVHTPCLLWGKGRVPAGVTCDRLVANTDFVPTILDLCGATPPAGLTLDGTSLLPLLAGQAPTAWRDALLLEIGHTRAVCTNRWTYIALRYPPGLQEKIRANTLGRPPYHMDTVFDLEEVARKQHPAYFDADQLYDLEKDPLEKTNLARDPASVETLKEMQARLRALLQPFARPFGEFRAG